MAMTALGSMNQAGFRSEEDGATWLMMRNAPWRFSGPTNRRRRRVGPGQLWLMVARSFPREDPFAVDGLDQPVDQAIHRHPFGFGPVVQQNAMAQDRFRQSLNILDRGMG